SHFTRRLRAGLKPKSPLRGCFAKLSTTCATQEWLRHSLLRDSDRFPTPTLCRCGHVFAVRTGPTTHRKSLVPWHARRILPLLAMRTTLQGGRLGQWRWVVERTFARRNQFRRVQLSSLRG